MKMEALVGDTTTYETTNRNPTIKFEREINSWIEDMRIKGKLTDNQAKYLKAHNTIAPGIYGLIKSKEGRHLRPVSTIESPTYKLSKLLSPILSNIVGESEYHVKDSWQFAEFIKNQKIPPGYILASLDVKSLYTNVSKNLSIQAIKKRWNKIKDKTQLTQQQFIDAIKLIIDKSYFQYGTNFYIQKFGLAMGNAISGFLADIVMEDLERSVLPNMPFPISLYKRYDDDILTAIMPGKENEAEVQRIFNSYNRKLHFTMEKENEDTKSINFLDMTITRTDDGTLSIKWYQKKETTGRYLNHRGLNPITHKRNVISELVDRAITFTNPTAPLRKRSRDSEK